MTRLPTPAQLRYLQTGIGTRATQAACAAAGWIDRTAWKERLPMEVTGMGKWVLQQMAEQVPQPQTGGRHETQCARDHFVFEKLISTAGDAQVHTAWA